MTTPKINDSAEDNTYNIVGSNIANDRTVTLPLLTGNDTFVFEDHEQTLINKTISGASNTISGLTVAQGGTGVATLAAGNFLEGNNTGNITATKAVPGGDVVGTSDTQTITNKTWDDNINMADNRIINLATPIDDADAATKAYADSVATGLIIKDGVTLASLVDLNSNGSISGAITYNETGGTSTRGRITATLAVSNQFTVDSVTLGSADDGTRILIKNQTNGDENGIWTTTISGTNLTLDRATDFDADPEVVSGVYIFIDQGTVNGSTSYVLTNVNPVIIGGSSGTNLVFAQFSKAEQIVAGDGISKIGTLMSIDLKANGGLVIESTEVGVDLGASSMTGTLPVGFGGTGASTFTSGTFLEGNGVNAITGIKAVPTGDVVGTSDLQTLANKTLTAPIISTISNTGTLTLPSSTDTLVGRATTDSLTNKTLVDNTTTFQDNTTGTKQMQFELSSVTAATTRIMTIPDADVNLIGSSAVITTTGIVKNIRFKRSKYNKIRIQ